MIRLPAVALCVLLSVALRAAPALSRGLEGMQSVGFIPVSDPYPAPRYDSATLKGPRLRVEDVEGKLVLLNFWATWCAPCRFEMPSMEELYQEFKKEGLGIVAVNLMEQRKTVQSFVRDGGFTFPVVLDETGEIAQRYGVHALPVTFVIDRKGDLIAKSMGYKDWYAEKMRHFIRVLVRDGRVVSEPIPARVTDRAVQADSAVLTNNGPMGKGWLFTAFAVLCLAISLLFIRKRRASMRR